MGTKDAKPEHEAFYQEALALYLKHTGHLDSIDLLAVAARAVGMILALQDAQRPKELYMMTIDRNIEDGNAYAIAQVALGTIKL